MICRLAAVSVGSAVPRPNFEAAVHSVFHSALNLMQAGDDLLLTLLLSVGADLPRGIRIDAPRVPALESLMVGTPAVCRDETLTIGDSLIVDLRPGRKWTSDLSSLEADMTDPAVVAAWGHAREALRQRQLGAVSPTPARRKLHRSPTYPSLLQRQIDCALQAILSATAAYDAAGVRGVDDLIGLGPGLTPAGDDLLTGYLAGLWCTARGKPQRLDFLLALAELVISGSTRTNDISRTYLCLAARGLVSSLLLDLAAAISTRADSASVRACAEAALQVGHSSGMETVRGLLLGLAAWDAPHLLA